jgi:hypothetical protein
MIKDLEKALKVEMSYQDTQAPKCKECLYCKIVRDPYLDCSWISLCCYNNIGDMPVEESSRCKFFIHKEKIK